jgi:hypothetical protein
LVLLQAAVGDAGEFLYINELDIDGIRRYFVGIRGDLGRFMRFGESAHTLANLVSNTGVVEFRLTKDDLSFWGGSRTIESGKEGNANTRVLVNAAQVPGALQNNWGMARFERGQTMRTMTPSIATWHEFGHAWGVLNGRRMAETGPESVDWENIMRQVVYGPFGPKNARRLFH